MRYVSSPEGIALCALLHQASSLPDPNPNPGARISNPTPADPTASEIEPLLASFLEELRSARLSPKTVSDTEAQIRRLLSLANIRVLADLQWRPIALALDELKKLDASPVTLNHYVGSIRRFTENLSAMSLYRGAPVLSHDPLVGLKRYPIERDRRLLRAAFTPEQWQQLLNSTIKSRKSPYRIKSRLRAAAYTCAIATGMRKSEVWKLTAQNCKLWDSDPHFFLRIGSTKNGRMHIARPSPDALEFLRDHCRGKIGSAALFADCFPRSRCDDVRMLRADVLAAGLNPFVLLGNGGHDEQLDWHAFRVSWVSWALERGATVQEVMVAIGHRSERMVMHYARLLEQRRRGTPQKLAGLFQVPVMDNTLPGVTGRPIRGVS